MRSGASISAVGDTGGEHCDTPGRPGRLNTALQSLAAHHVTVVAATGDIGVVGEPCSLARSVFGGAPFTPVKAVNMPAADPLTLGAGGTTLNASHKVDARRARRVGRRQRAPPPGLRQPGAVPDRGPPGLLLARFTQH